MSFTCNVFAQSIIVKVRSTNSISSPSSLVTNITSKYCLTTFDKAQRIARHTSGVTPQSISGSFGLDRIVILRLRDSSQQDNALEAFRSSEEVEYAEPNYIYRIDGVSRPNDSLYSEQWHLENMRVRDAWSITKGDTSIKIGFIDTGVEWEHPDLADQFAVNGKEDRNGNGLFDAWSSIEERRDFRGNLVFGDLDDIDDDRNGYIDDVIGFDFVDQDVLNFGDAAVRDAIPADEFGHGTGVAGVISAKENNVIGVAGIAPHCRLVALRSFDATGNAENDDIASAIVYAADNNVRILNLSFGDVVASRLQRDVIRYAESKGMLVFASSGNRGGDDRHYPSDFDECVSVGATANQPREDVLYSFTTRGENMDLVAPGGNIVTTDIDGKYQTTNGTSFSSPAAAAIAGLVLAKNPHLTPRELRSILASTTIDIPPHGYDHETANGRVDAFAAVSYIGSASIKITTPNTDTELARGDTVQVTGYAAAALFTSYTISYAKGLNPKDGWSVIDSSNEQTFGSTLGEWNTAGLGPGVYTLRLAVTSSDRRSTEEHITVHLRTEEPQFVSHAIDTLYQDGKRALLIRVKADTLVNATLRYKSDGADWLSKQDDRLQKGHFFILSTSDVPAGSPLLIQIELHNAGGVTVSDTIECGIPNEAVSETGFNTKPYSLPLGFLLDTVITTPQSDHVIMSVFPPSADFGSIYEFTFEGDRFIPKDSLMRSWVPRGVGNTTGDSKPELLLQAGTQYILYKQNGSHTLLGDVVSLDTSDASRFFVLGFADADNDGKDEIITRRTTSTGRDLIELQKRSNASLDIIATFENPTLPAQGYSENRYSRPDSRTLMIDGRQHIVILDDDADLLVFRYDITAKDNALLIYRDENEGTTDGNMVTIADFNGDGDDDIAFAYHTSYEENRDKEYEYPFWTLKILLGNGDGTFTSNSYEHFSDARSDRPYRSSLGAMPNVTGSGASELALSLFPNFYLFSFSESQNRLLPVWRFPVSVSPRIGLAYDFDRNGKREVAINTGDAIRFFERDDEYTERPPSPAGFEVLPRDTNRVDLYWSTVKNATRYLILRAEFDTPQYEVIDSTTATSFTDTTADNGKFYHYSVVTIDEASPVRTSLPAFSQDAFVHPMPKMLSAHSEGASITLAASQPLSERQHEADIFTVDVNKPTSSVIVSGDSTIVVSIDQPLEDGMHSIKLHSFALRDKWNSPFDTSQVVQWIVHDSSDQKQFYIVKWNFLTEISIYLQFNLPPSMNALETANYSLTPYGRVTDVERDVNNSNAVLITLDNAMPVQILGVPFVLCVENVTSDDNVPLNRTEGNCAGVSFTADNLDNVLVYPNPAKPSDEKMTFAGLTAEAEISIFSASRRFLRRIRTTERKGGVEWDMRDEQGNTLPSGIYLYHVTGKNDNGIEVPANESKFVIVRDR